MTDTQEEQTENPQENVRMVPVAMPFQFGASPPMVQGPQGPMPAPPGPNCPVMIVLGQGGWGVQAQFSQNDALDFARRIRQAVKAAAKGAGIVAVHAPILGPNGVPISSPRPIEDDEDDDLEMDEPDRENEALA